MPCQNRSDVLIKRPRYPRPSGSCASQQNRQSVLSHAFLLAQESRIESRIASRGNRSPGGCQASENIAAARGNTSAKLRCVSITHAYNIVRQYNASFGKFFLVLLETFEHVVCLHWHTAAQLYKFFAASYRGCSAFFRIVLRLSNIEVDGRNLDGNREKPRWDDRRDGTIADSPLHRFLLIT